MVSNEILRKIPADIQKLLAEFPGILRGDDAPPAPTHGVEHVIETSGRPIFSKAPRLDSEKLNIAKREFQHLEKLGLVRRSTSPWASPLHMVPKPGGRWRPCGDYCRLNQITTPDRYPLPNMQDLANHATEPHYTFQPFQVQLHAVWAAQRRPDVPAAD